MGQELSIGPPVRNAEAPVPIEGAKVVWRQLDTARDPASTPRSSGGLTATPEIVDVAWSPALANDPDLMIATLRAERAGSRAGFDHPHTASGCSFCRRAAAAYR